MYWIKKHKTNFDEGKFNNVGVFSKTIGFNTPARTLGNVASTTRMLSKNMQKCSWVNSKVKMQTHTGRE